MAVATRALPGLLAFLAVGGTALVNGGYFPTEWGWPALASLLVVAAAAIVGDRFAFGRLDWALLGLLGTFTAWTGLSIVWSTSAGPPVAALEQLLVYLSAVAAALVVSDRLSAVLLPVGVLCATTAIGGYALATRLAPDHVGTFAPGDSYQLSTPFGYWNALGIFVTIGALVATGLAAHAGRVAARCAAAVSLVVLVPTLYFTFSRGAWAALGLGLLAALALEPRRLRLAVTLVGVLAAPALAVLVASRSSSLTQAGAPLADAARDGHHLVVLLVACAGVAIGLVVALSRLEPRLELDSRGRRILVAALACLGAAAVAVALIRIGNPVTFVGRATDAFRADTTTTGGDLNKRLFSLSGHGRSDYWRVGWREVRDEPVLGGGAGSFARYWIRYRPTSFGARNAHNLYLETLAELGPLGLLLLVGVLAVPLVAAVRTRQEGLSASVAAAYVAFLGHAAIDWDWQVSGVVLAALFCATALVVWARPRASSRRASTGLRVATLAFCALLVAFVFVAQLGNTALAASDRAAARDDQTAAEAHAHNAVRWLPWSAEPWQRVGEAQLAQGELGRARQSFRKALDLDRSSWSIWFDLALASSGDARAQALAAARRLNPRGPELLRLKP